MYEESNILAIRYFSAIKQQISFIQGVPQRYSTQEAKRKAYLINLPIKFSRNYIQKNTKSFKVKIKGPQARSS